MVSYKLKQFVINLCNDIAFEAKHFNAYYFLSATYIEHTLLELVAHYNEYAGRQSLIYLHTFAEHLLRHF